MADYAKYYEANLPKPVEIIADLTACHGDVQEFLRRHAQTTTRYSAILFAILQKQQTDETFKQEWEEIVEQGEAMSIQLLHSRLIEAAKKMAEREIICAQCEEQGFGQFDPAEALKILERLQADKWGRRTGKAAPKAKTPVHGRLSEIMGSL